MVGIPSVRTAQYPKRRICDQARPQVKPANPVVDRVPGAEELPDEGDELLRPLAVGHVTGKVTPEKVLLAHNAPAVGRAEQSGDEGDDGRAARGEGEPDPGQ